MDERPQYLCDRDSFVDEVYIPANEPFRTETAPDPGWLPLNDAAEKALRTR